MPYSSFYSSAQPSGAGPPPFLECSPEEKRDGSGYQVAGSMGSGEMGSLSHARRMPQELDLDGYECESEEGAEVSEGPAKLGPPRPSGTKRSRAAEVHNLSEKRRRSRINEKMKALQNLIPNSNKTDKASMLDEAIEYLKQLQLQVQMLSMRNGLNLHPMYLSGTLQPLQASSMRMPFGVDGGSMINMGGMLPLNQDTSSQSSFDLPSRCASSHQPVGIPGVTSVTNPDSSFRIESSQSQHGSFHLPVPPKEMLTGDMARQQLNAGPSTRSLSDGMNSMMMTGNLPFVGRTSLLETQHVEPCMLGREGSQDMASKNPDQQMFVQNLHRLQTERNFPGPDVKSEESPEF